MARNDQKEGAERSFAALRMAVQRDTGRNREGRFGAGFLGNAIVANGVLLCVCRVQGPECARALRGEKRNDSYVLLNFGDFSVGEDYFHVGVEVHLLGAEVDDFLGLAEDFDHLVGGLAEGDGFRRGG